VSGGQKNPPFCHIRIEVIPYCNSLIELSFFVNELCFTNVEIRFLEANEGWLYHDSIHVGKDIATYFLFYFVFYFFLFFC
jgi:hypothetical protein